MYSTHLAILPSHWSGCYFAAVSITASLVMHYKLYSVTIFLVNFPLTQLFPNYANYGSILIGGITRFLSFLTRGADWQVGLTERSPNVQPYVAPSVFISFE